MTKPELPDGWFSMEDAPHNRPIIGMVEGQEYEVQWAESRRCMLAGIGGGNGYYGPGWEDTYNHLISETPTMWKECT